MNKDTDKRLKTYQEKVGREQDQMPTIHDRLTAKHASTMQPRKLLADLPAEIRSLPDVIELYRRLPPQDQYAFLEAVTKPPAEPCKTCGGDGQICLYCGKRESAHSICVFQGISCPDCQTGREPEGKPDPLFTAKCYACEKCVNLAVGCSKAVDAPVNCENWTPYPNAAIEKAIECKDIANCVHRGNKGRCEPDGFCTWLNTRCYSYKPLPKECTLLRGLKPEQVEAGAREFDMQTVCNFVTDSKGCNSSLFTKQLGCQLSKALAEIDRLEAENKRLHADLFGEQACYRGKKKLADALVVEIDCLKDREKIILDSASQAHEDADRLELRLAAADEVNEQLADAGNEKDAEIAEAKMAISLNEVSWRSGQKDFDQLKAELAEARDAIAKGFDEAAQRLLQETDKLRYESKNKQLKAELAEAKKTQDAYHQTACNSEKKFHAEWDKNKQLEAELAEMCSITNSLKEKVFKELSNSRQLRAALERIQTWAKAYPLKIFPEPDLKKVAKALKDNSLTIDAVAASNMRYVLKGVSGIVDEALK